LGCLDGCALQFVSTPTTAHHVPNLRLHSLFVGEMGGREGHAAYPTSHGEPASHAALYRTLLRELGLYLTQVHTSLFCEDTQIPDEAFVLALLPLGLSLFPESMLPEIVGVALYYYLVGGAFALAGLAAGTGLAGRPFLAAHPIPDGLTPSVMCTIDAAVTLLERGDEPMVGRVWQAFRAMASAESAWVEAVLAPLESRPATPRERMIAMIARKAPFAHGHHGRRKLNGCPIDSGLAPGANIDELLTALATSSFVCPGQAEASRFLTRSISLDGPMCGIFAADEVEMIADWIRSLPDSTDDEDARGLPCLIPPDADDEAHTRAKAIRDALATFRAEAAQNHAQMPVRGLFHRLLRPESFPDTVEYAKHYARRHFQDAAAGIDEGDPHDLIPSIFSYTPAALDRWRRRQVRLQIEDTRASGRDNKKTREQYRDVARQYVVQLLTDGVILHRAFSMSLADTRLGRLLFQTFSDECGQGDEVALHTNIARRYFAVLDIVHPEIDDPELSTWPALHDSSYLGATLLLAASLHPRLFLPEVLGLNFSLEVGALGGWMAASRDEARRFGAPATYFEVHNTIDNLDTGHSGFARDMITHHLDDVLLRGGVEDRDRHWARIWTGLRAGNRVLEEVAAGAGD
jgi:hypothetical protein